jgi:hypothetical protein
LQTGRVVIFKQQIGQTYGAWRIIRSPVRAIALPGGRRSRSCQRMASSVSPK